MSPNGTLLAYSKPVDIKELRDQAALISIAWKEHCQGRKSPLTLEQRKDSTRNESSDGTASQSLKPALQTLTIESMGCNILVRLLQPQLLLVLVGRIPPNKKQSFKIYAEAQGDARYPLVDTHASRYSPGEADNASTMSQRDKDIKMGVLHVQRKRLDALADYILNDFEATNFIMPADSDLQ